jgi:hypothetical protein
MFVQSISLFPPNPAELMLKFPPYAIIEEKLMERALSHLLMRRTFHAALVLIVT